MNASSAAAAMESILNDLSENSKKLYSCNKFKEVEDMFNTFIKEAEAEAPNLRAKAFNNRGHAKYMQVNNTDGMQSDRKKNAHIKFHEIYFQNNKIALSRHRQETFAS